MNFVLDASVALSWCFEDEGDDYAVGVLDALRTSEAVVASQWPLEMSNGLFVAERRGRIDGAGAARFMELVLSLPIVVDPVSRSRAFNVTHALARTHGLSAYDAAYLDVALRQGVSLATLDARLRSAAAAEGVPLFG